MTFRKVSRITTFFRRFIISMPELLTDNKDITGYYDRFFDLLVGQQVEQSIAAVEEAIEAGIAPQTILLEVVCPAMDEVGRMQANREITLSEIYAISRIGEAAINRLVSFLSEPPEPVGTVVIGTVAGDYHGMGRNIVAAFLRMAGFEVHDLGMSVPSQTFVDKALALNAGAICASALLLHTAEKITEIRGIMRERGIEDRVKLIAGGAPFNFDPELYRTLGADATAPNASDAVEVVSQLLGVKHRGTYDTL